MTRGGDLLTLPLRDLTLELTHLPVGAELARDGGLTADECFSDAPGSNCRSEPARDSGLIGGDILAGVHIHSCGYGCYWFRFYSESLGKAPSNQTLLPLSSGASPGLGIPSLRSCSVGPPRSAIHGRARLTRHPCRVTHCAEPALGLPMGQEDQKQIKSQNAAFFKVVVASPVVLRDFYDHCQLPFRVQIYRPDWVPVACLT